MHLFTSRLYFFYAALVLGMGSIQPPTLAESKTPIDYYATRTDNPTLVQRQKLNVSLRNIISIIPPKFSLRTAGLSTLFIFSMQNLGIFANRYFLKACLYIVPRLPQFLPTYVTRYIRQHWPVGEIKLRIRLSKEPFSVSYYNDFDYTHHTLIPPTNTDILAQKVATITLSILQCIAEGLFFQKLVQNLLIALFKNSAIGIINMCFVWEWPGPYGLLDIYSIEKYFGGLALGYDYFWTKDLRYGILGQTLWYLCDHNKVLRSRHVVDTASAGVNFRQYAFLPASITNLADRNGSDWHIPIWVFIAVFSGNELYAQYQQNQGVAYVSLFKRISKKLSNEKREKPTPQELPKTSAL